jgi:hypothetical protein
MELGAATAAGKQDARLAIIACWILDCPVDNIAAIGTAEDTAIGYFACIPLFAGSCLCLSVLLCSLCVGSLLFGCCNHPWVVAVAADIATMAAIEGILPSFDYHLTQNRPYVVVNFTNHLRTLYLYVYKK